MKLPQNVLLISIIPQNLNDEDALKDLREVKSLIESYGGVLADVLIQRRENHHKGKYIGQGKITEAANIIKEKNIEIVVLNAIINPGQIYDIREVFIENKPQIIVWDRADLILQIFSKHAHTAEAKLQIELAAMRHMGPRIYGMGMVLSRQSGGIGMRGIGETNTELMKRHWRDQIKKVREKLLKLSKERKRQLEKRQNAGFETVSIIGYTNAGKTSLFNLLSGKKKLAENALFATLDSTVGKLYLPILKREVLISDTIGFIQNLPLDLIEAFKSTLMESIHADLLLHVIDLADEDLARKTAVVERILHELGILEKKRIFVFNKIDAVENLERNKIHLKYAQFSPQFISVRTGEGIDHLLSQITSSIKLKHYE